MIKLKLRAESLSELPFVLRSKQKILQSLLYTCWENEKLPAEQQLVGITVSPHTGHSSKSLLPLTQTRLKPRLPAHV